MYVHVIHRWRPGTGWRTLSGGAWGRRSGPSRKPRATPVGAGSNERMDDGKHVQGLVQGESIETTKPIHARTHARIPRVQAPPLLSSSASWCRWASSPGSTSSASCLRSPRTWWAASPSSRSPARSWSWCVLGGLDRVWFKSSRQLTHLPESMVTVPTTQVPLGDDNVTVPVAAALLSTLLLQ